MKFHTEEYIWNRFYFRCGYDVKARKGCLCEECEVWSMLQQKSTLCAIKCYIGQRYTGIWLQTVSLHSEAFRINISHHDEVIKWKHLPRCWPFVRGIHRWPVNSPHNGQLRGALMFSLICAWINGELNTGGAGDSKLHRAKHDVTVMECDVWHTIYHKFALYVIKCYIGQRYTRSWLHWISYYSLGILRTNTLYVNIPSYLTKAYLNLAVY